ncbi:hypothetical protein DL770_000555 [Monosporascus sp. CRB-9-2]|nr:hypothetical protein DL770_000555 [Monosporascus sp. CRB-9-2]
MGRWGHRLFEVDHDIGIALEVIQDFCKGTRSLGWTTTPSKKLNSGLGEQLLQKYRLDEGGRSSFAAGDNHHEVIMFGATMMLVGATIKENDIRHLRELVPVVKCNDLLTNLTEGDGCFRGHGKRQYLAPLDNYQPGLSRDFGKPSCHACGRTHVDGKDIERCGGCHNKMGAA